MKKGGILPIVLAFGAGVVLSAAIRKRIPQIPSVGYTESYPAKIIPPGILRAPGLRRHHHIPPGMLHRLH